MNDLYANGRRLRRERFDVLRDWTKLCELEAPDGATIRMQTGAKVKTALSGTFRKDGRVDWLSDMIRPMVWEDGQWQPLGVFVVANATEDYIDDAGFIQIDARDCGEKVQRRTVERDFFLRAKTLYMTAIQELLTASGIERMRVEPSEAVLVTDRADWEIGTSYLDIVNQLLSEINYADLWFDAEGYARVEPVRTSTDIQERGYVLHTYRADEFSILDAAYTIESSAYSAYNVFIALVSSPDLDAPLVATAENNDPYSPLSVQARGRIPMPVIRLDSVAGQEELQAYVDRLREQSVISTQTVEFTTAVVRHGVGDFVFLDHHQAKGVWKETEWSIRLGPGGTMSHRAVKDMLV